MKKIFFVFLCLVSFFISVNAQKRSPHFLINADYAYQNANTLGVGPEVYFVYSNNQITSINANGVYNISNSEIFPELNVTHHFNIEFLNPYLSNMKSNFLSLGASASTNYLRPEFGINFLDMITLKTGYNFSVDKNNLYEGIVTGINIHIPVKAFGIFF